MTVLRASNAPVGLNKGKAIRATNTPWARPTDWVTFTTPTSSEQKVIGIVAVYNQASNYIALETTVSSGTYTVDWGDGTSGTFTSGTTAEKNYTWSSISSSTLTSQGYRQAVITVTPTTGGATFSAVRLDRRNSAITSNSTLASNPWLDIAVAAPNATTIAFSYNNFASRTATMPLCEQINIVAHNTTNMAFLFYELRKLQSVAISSTASVTDMASMFNTCTSLQTVPLFNTAAVTNMQGMFASCRFLQTIPLFNTAAVTNMVQMFFNCSALQTVPLLNTVAVTGINQMFNGCTALQTVPLFNTASVTNMSSMLNGCSALQSVPLFNTAAVTNMSAMFGNCFSLQSVPLFNTAAVTDMSQMFNNCTSLNSVPLFNTTAVTNVNAMFGTNSSLQNIPELTFTAITSVSNNAAGLNASAFNLGQVKLTGNRWTQSFQNCKLGAAQLDEMYTALATLNPAVTTVTGNGTTVTYTIADRRAFVAGRTVTMTGIDPVAYNLTNATIVTVTAGAGNTGTFTVTNAATGTYVSGGVAAIQSDRTITVTSNPGTTGDDPTIATNKGWTVTG